MTRPHLLERSHELGRLESLVADVGRGAGRAVAITGEPGLGTTALIRAAQDMGRRARLTVLAAGGGEFETGHSYGVVRQLFERLVSDQGDARWHLSGRARAAGAALGIERGSPPPDPFDVRHGLFWLTANLATERPLLITVDDAHWADEASLQFLLYTLRRLTDLPLGVLLAARGRPGSPNAELVDAILEHPGLERLTPASLSPSATGELVRGVLGDGGDQAFVDACHRATGGNPFLVVELLRAFDAEGIAPDAASADRIAQLAPPSVAHRVLVRLTHLPSQARDLARAVAVLGAGAHSGQAAAVAGLTPDEARKAAEALEGAGVVAVGGSVLQFVHPMLATVVYQDLGRAAQSATHVQAARVLAAAGAAERAAVHLLRSEPAADAWVVNTLAAAARNAPPEVAASLLARALAEPPAPQDRAAILVALGESELLVGLPAAEHLEEALRGAVDADARERAVRALARARTLAGDVDAAVTLLEGELERVGAGQPERATRLGGDLAEIAIASHAHVGRLVPRLERLAAGPPGRARRAAATALVVRRYEHARGTPAELIASAEWALDGRGYLDDIRAGSLTPVWVVDVLTRVDGYAPARAVAETALEEAHAHNRVLVAALLEGWLGYIESRTGSLVRAQVHLETGLRLADADAAPLITDFLVGMLVGVLVQRGEVDTAESVLAGHDLGRRAEPEVHLLLGRARLRLAQGRFAEAAADATAVLAIGDARGVAASAIGARALLARSVRALGDHQRASTLLDEEWAAAERFGVPSEIGAARRERALGTGGPGAMLALQRAVDELAATPCRLEHAATLVELGAALRRANLRRDARRPLLEALDLAAAAGARSLADRAEQELAAAGARPRARPATGVAALTPSELRVAELAASGLSNDAIAGKLFVTRKTIESQMGAAFRKLGVRRRHELGRALGVDG